MKFARADHRLKRWILIICLVLLLSITFCLRRIPALALYHASKLIAGFSLSTATSMAEFAVSMDPEYYECFIQLGGLQDMQQKTDLAIKYFIIASELQPSNVVAYRCLGELYLRQERFEEAYGAFQKATELANDTLTPYDMEQMGISLIKLGKYAEASRVLERAISLEHSYLLRANYAGYLCISYVKLNQRTKAEDLFNQYNWYLKDQSDVVSAVVLQQPKE